MIPWDLDNSFVELLWDGTMESSNVYEYDPYIWRPLYWTIGTPQPWEARPLLFNC